MASQKIEIAFLADHLDTIPTLAEWFIAQWPDYFSKRPFSQTIQEFHAEAQIDKIPIRLIAFVDDELAGTVTLRERAIESAPEFTPGLGGLLVIEKYRRKGVGTALVHAGMTVARDVGFAQIYATTVNARRILENLGWQFDQQIVHYDEVLALYQYHL